MSHRMEDEDFFVGETGGAFDKSAGRSDDVPPGEEMRALLEKWSAPDAPPSLDRRLMAAYRKQISTPPWKRAFASSIRVPLPVAAAVVLLLLASGLLALRPSRPLTPQVTADPESREVRVVEVPVVQERMVTRTVYVGKGHNIKAHMNTSRSFADVGSRKATAQDEASGLYFTRTDLSGFQPLPQMTIEVIKRIKTDED